MHQITRRQLIATQACIGKQGACTTVNIDPTVHLGGTSVGRNRVELFLVLHKVLCQSLKALGAFLKVHCHQCRQAFAAGMLHRLTKIERFGMGVGNGRAVDSTAQRAGSLCTLPATADITLNGLCHGAL